MPRRKIKRAIKKIIELITLILSSTILALFIYIVFYEMAVFVNYLVPLP